MAYLIGPFLVVGLWAGIGLYGLLVTTQLRSTPTAVLALVCLAFLVGPVLQIVRNAPRISLRHYNEGQAYIETVFARFEGKNEGAVLLNDWEHMTPLWYAQYVDGRIPDPADVRLELVAAGGQNPWQQGIFDYLPGGPVYFSNFRPGAVAGTEFRLRPAGLFYEVLEPGNKTIPEELAPVAARGGEIDVVAYQLPRTAVTAGDFVPFTLAMRAPNGTADFYIPVLSVGEIRFEFTTDSHLTTPNWWPGEVIVERFDFALPHDMGGGRYPLRLNLKNLSANEEIESNLFLGELEVIEKENPIETEHLLANFRHRVGLVRAVARGNGRRVHAPWNMDDALLVNQGDTINLTIEWESLDVAEESYTVFVHLIDANNTPYVALDYTPLGGATPTHLWIPKWLPGQHMLDPYRLPIPPDLPPGTYFIEAGLYEMVGGRRLHIANENGHLQGDRFILGGIIVTEGE